MARAAWQRLRGGELSAARAAASVAAGLAVGVTPLFGFHLLLVLAICLPLRLDARVAYVAAHVSVPPLAPFILAAEVNLGFALRSGHWGAWASVPLASHEAWDRAKDLGAGTLVLAPLAGALGGLAAFGVASWVKRAGGRQLVTWPGEGDFDQARLATHERYSSRAARGYVRTKLAIDPVARDIARLGPLGEVVDVGCGRGQLLVLLAELGHLTRGRGTDWDAPKLEIARNAAQGLPLGFVGSDVTTLDFAECDTVLLIDVLHYLDDVAQERLLTEAGQRAREYVIVRDADPGRGPRSWLTHVQEFVTTKVGFNRGARIRVRPIACTTQALERCGFEVQVSPCWGMTPFANVLIVARRPGRSAPSR